MKQADLYAVLGVRRDATQAEIKAAHRRLAFATHPDRNPGDARKEARFKEATSAYRVLGDRTKREAYDQTLVAAKRVAEAAARVAAEAKARASAAEAVRRATQAAAEAARTARQSADNQMWGRFSVPATTPSQGGWGELLAGVATVGLGILVAMSLNQQTGSQAPNLETPRGPDGRFRKR